MNDEWDAVALSDLVARVTAKNSQNFDKVFTVSAQMGLVDQEAYFKKRVASKNLANYFVVEPGDYVFNKSYSEGFPLGVVARNKTDEAGVVSPLYIVMRASSNRLIDGWIDLAFDSPEYRESLQGLMKEGGRAHGALNVKLSDYFSAMLPVPPLPVQRRIVDLMSHLDAHIANLRAEREALSVALRTYRMVTFTHIKDQWPLVKLGDIVESLDSLRRPVKSADRVPGPYPYYGASGVVDFVSDWIFEGQALLVSEDGANLRARSSPIAFCADGRYWVNNHAHVLRALESTTNDYLAHYLECADIDLALTGTTMPKLNAANLLKIEVPQPPLSIQQDLTETLERLSASITESQCESQRLGELRTTILEGLLAGSFEISSDYDSLLLGEVA